MHIFLFVFVFSRVKYFTYYNLDDRKLKRGNKDKYYLAKKKSWGNFVSSTRKNMTKKSTKIRTP